MKHWHKEKIIFRLFKFFLIHILSIIPAGKFCRFFMIHGKLYLTSFIMEKH